ncbi:hypothetical protein [Acinetobacter sp. TSRC1-2]|uniref:hypothetical protein n=1 Tax=unclassified Acinetobacter TaxID=196816 RepID=UPI003CF825F4
MADHLENSDLIIQLPWTVLQQENTQAVVLEQPNDQKLFLDIQHSTDWVVATSIFVSGMISFIGFLITIYVVRKSTYQNIEINKDLIDEQNKLKITGLEIIYQNQELDKLKVLNETVSQSGIILISSLNFFEEVRKRDINSILPMYNYMNFQRAISTIIAYIRPGVEMDEDLRIQIFNLISISQLIMLDSELRKTIIPHLSELEEKFGYFQASLNFYILQKYKKAA